MVVKPDPGDGVPATEVSLEGVQAGGLPVARRQWWRRRVVRVPVWLLLVVFALVAVGAYPVWKWGKNHSLWSPTWPLGPLKHDPLAAKDLLGLKLRSSKEYQAASLDNLLNIEPHGSGAVQRVFEVGYADRAKLLADVTTYAVAYGWIVEPRALRAGVGGTSVSFYKPRGDKSMQASVDYREGGPDTGPALSVFLGWKEPPDNYESYY
jgi:amino acid transporter